MGSLVVLGEKGRGPPGTEPPAKEQPMLARREAGRRRPHVVLAHSDAAYAAGVARAFRRHGWVVAPAASGPEARRLASALAADLVVLEADLPAESGWLTC